MNGVPDFQPDPREPIAFFSRNAENERRSAGVRQRDFEFSSRGDRVPGRLLLPASASGPLPLVLTQHGAGGAKDDDSMDAVCLPWAQRGAAVACIDFPLHGERASAKLSERILGLLQAARPLCASEAELWTGFVCQAVIDLRRAVDALVALPEIDAARVGYAGFSLGSILGAPFCAEEPRIRAATLALGGGGIGPKATDPVDHIARFAPRPLLFVNATRDERISRERAEALHAAAREPKQVLWFEGTHAALPGAALKAMWEFLKRHLEIRDR